LFITAKDVKDTTPDLVWGFYFSKVSFFILGGYCYFSYVINNKLMEKLKIGDKVLWRGGFGIDPAQEAIIDGIEITKGGKYGKPVDEGDWDQVYGRNLVVTLENGKWAYASQISKLWS
jgi:hypothetical protein